MSKNKAANPKNLSRVSLNHPTEPTTLLVSKNSETSNLNLNPNPNSTATKKADRCTSIYLSIYQSAATKKADRCTSIYLSIYQSEREERGEVGEVLSMLRRKWRLS